MAPRRSMKARKPPPIVKRPKSSIATDDDADPRLDPKLVRVVRTVVEYPRPIALVGLILFRITNALLIDTFFQPDEYFQSLEPAWQLAFGHESGAWITWEWREQLRSSIHPYMFAAVYKVADWMCTAAGCAVTTRSLTLLTAPKILQAVLAASMDYYTWIFAIKHAQPALNIPTAALLLTVLSPWQWFFAPRTLINSLEGTLTAAALFHWPWEHFLTPKAASSSIRGSLLKSLVLAALACVLRAPNVLIWIVVVGCCSLQAIICRGKAAIWPLSRLVVTAVCCGSAVLLISALFDRRYYGDWTLPPLQFLQFNLVQNLAVFYGRNRPDYYLTEGLPLLLTTALPFAVIGLYTAIRKTFVGPQGVDQLSTLRDTTLAWAVLLTIAGLSYIPHKEVRFLEPLFPALVWLAARTAGPLIRKWSASKHQLKSLLPLGLLVVNAAIALYASRYHQRGVIDVVHHLRHEYEHNYMPLGVPMTAGFLMPCHSTPWRSHLVWPELDAWALSCEPPLHMSLAEREVYLDEADVFYKDPEQWLTTIMQPTSSIKHAKDGQDDQATRKRPWPSHLVFFEALEPTLQGYLEGTAYAECWRGFNSHFHDDSRRTGDVVVWCLD